MIPTWRECITCCRVQSLEAFPKSKRMRFDRLRRCRSCETFRQREWRKHNKEKNSKSQQNSQLRRNYGITLEDFECMFFAQAGACAICRQPETAKDRHSGNILRLSVDHDHETGLVRGLLCARCNKGLGLFGDNSETIKAAAAYLDEADSPDGRTI